MKDHQDNILGGVEVFRDLSLVEEFRKELDSRFQVGDMVSRSPLMQKLFRILPQVAESRSTLLVQGETGTGKELLSRAIHDLSPCQKKPFASPGNLRKWDIQLEPGLNRVQALEAAFSKLAGLQLANFGFAMWEAKANSRSGPMWEQPISATASAAAILTWPGPSVRQVQR